MKPISVLVCTFLILTASAWAQFPGGGGRTGRRGGGYPPGQTQGGPSADPAERRAQMVEMISRNLNLADDQKKQFTSILEDSAKAAAPVQQQVAKGRQDLLDAVKTGKSDEEIEKLAAAQGAALGQMAAIEGRAFFKLFNILTPDQRSNADAVYPRFVGIFDTPRWGGGPRMGRQGYGRGR